MHFSISPSAGEYPVEAHEDRREPAGTAREEASVSSIHTAPVEVDSPSTNTSRIRRSVADGDGRIGHYLRANVPVRQRRADRCGRASR